MKAKWERLKLRLRRIASWDSVPNSVFILAVVAFVLLPIAFLRPYPHPESDPYFKCKITKVQISNFETALDAFKIVVGRYPATTEGLRVLIEKPANDPGYWERPFMKNVPLDPWGNEYQYVYPGVHNVDSYDLSSFGPDGKPGGGDDIVNWWENAARH
jgi:general secretion pathway protein G